MTSEAQIEANRRNAQRSTGPRTEAGKAVSRRNALRHGLAARTLMTAGEDVAEFEAFAEDLRHDLAPEGAMEEALVQRIVLCAWRLERIARIEADILMADSEIEFHSGNLPELPVGIWPKEMPQIGRYEASLDRSFERAMRMLRERQKARLRGELPEPTERTQFAEPAPEAEPEEPAERTQFPAAEDEEAVGPQDILSAEGAEEPQGTRTGVPLRPRRAHGARSVEKV